MNNLCPDGNLNQANNLSYRNRHGFDMKAMPIDFYYERNPLLAKSFLSG